MYIWCAAIRGYSKELRHDVFTVLPFKHSSSKAYEAEEYVRTVICPIEYPDLIKIQVVATLVPMEWIKE